MGWGSRRTAMGTRVSSIGRCRWGSRPGSIARSLELGDLGGQVEPSHRPTLPSRPMTPDRDRILELLELEAEGVDVFLAPTPGDRPRLFGGQVASQSLRAATLTVDEGRPPHSFHAYFIRPGRPGVPLRLAVERT